MAFEALIDSDLVTKSWKATKTAYSRTQQFHIEEVDETVFFAFRPTFSVKDWFSPTNKASFGEVKIDRNQFPCLRSIGKDIDATVNEAFLRNLEVLISSRSSFRDWVKTAVNKKQQIIFTGHSSGGAIAILATVWYLETYFKTPTNIPEPRCLTFGAPLVGDNIFKHALGRENWNQFFFNFVARFDIVPRIMLAQRSSTEKSLPHVLGKLDPTKPPIQETDQTITEFYGTVMKETSSVAYKAVCEMIGNGEAFLETLSGFLELSPYRPVGSFVFFTEKRMVAVKNSDAILQILFYAGNGQDFSVASYRSVEDHYRYDELVKAMGMKFFNYLDLDHLEGEPVLNDLGLNTRAKQCVYAAFKTEKQQLDNQKTVDEKRSKIIEKLKWIEEQYKPRCRSSKTGYYDSFKASTEEIDFEANVKRAELAGIYDETLGLIKKGQLPDGFEGCNERIELSTRYRRLVEPIDIANYHRHLKNEDTGPYMVHGRPNRYKHSQRWYEHERLKKGNKVNGFGSCFWAEVEEFMGKPHGEVEEKIKDLEFWLEELIVEKEVDGEEIVLEGSTFRQWWNLLPESRRQQSPFRGLMGEPGAI